MPEIQPFSALRFNTDKIEDLGRVLVPPYDVINEAERARLAAEAFSPVRLTLGPAFENDSDTSNRYTRSRDLFRQWIEQGILVRDESPSLYALAQDFQWNGVDYIRWHLISACRLYEFSEQVILPHEQILQGPKDDRQRLIEASEANYEPLFGLVMGQTGLHELLTSAAVGDPLIDAVPATGDRQRVWRISDPDAIRNIQAAVADAVVVIADGHHRYTASLGVKREKNQEFGAGPWDYAMMTLSAMDDPGLLVLPTHRMVSELENLVVDDLIAALDAYFVIEEKDSLQEMLDQMDETPGIAMGMAAWPESYFLLTPWDEERISDAIAVQRSETWKSLDVSVLHGLVMDRVLGLGAGESRHITYTRKASEADEAVRRRKSQLAFFLKSTPKDAVQTIALLGETMPQKSTFFYPKLITGLLIRAWD